MENSKVKILIEGVDPQTGEAHKMNFEGDAICTVVIKETDDRISAEECLMGNVNLDRAMAMVKGLTSACRHLLEELPPALSRIITSEMLREMLVQVGNDEQAAVKAYDEGRLS